MTNDRIRAKKPNKNVHSWSSGKIEETAKKDYGYDIKIENGPYLSVTNAVYELFVERLDEEKPEGETAWYKKKS
jgi:hypothetical protein